MFGTHMTSDQSNACTLFGGDCIGRQMVQLQMNSADCFHATDAHAGIVIDTLATNLKLGRHKQCVLCKILAARELRTTHLHRVGTSALTGVDKHASILKSRPCNRAAMHASNERHTTAALRNADATSLAMLCMRDMHTIA